MRRSRQPLKIEQLSPSATPNSGGTQEHLGHGPNYGARARSVPASSDASIPRSETVEKLHVQVPGLPFQVASIRTLYACCAWSDCFGMRQITPNWPKDVAGCSGSERKNSTGLPVASVSFAVTPVTLSNGGNCSVIG